MPKKNKKQKKSNMNKKSMNKKSMNKKSMSKKSNIKDSDIKSLSVEDQSLLDYKTSKSFTVATSLSEYKSQSHIGEIYDYKPLHDKINTMCVNKIISKEPLLNKKISKELCECIFDKNKKLSIHELEERLHAKKDIPSINCITIYDKYIKNKKTKKSKSKISKSKSSKTLKKTKSTKNPKIAKK